MKEYKDGKKVYLCNKCGQEVYSLLCRRIDGADWDVCASCHDEEVEGNESN